MNFRHNMVWFRVDWSKKNLISCLPSQELFENKVFLEVVERKT